MNAVLVTFSTAASLLIALKARIIQVTDRFADTVSSRKDAIYIFFTATSHGHQQGIRASALSSSKRITKL